MITDVNSEDRLVQETFAEHLRQKFGWDSVYAWDQETFGPEGLLGREGPREVVLLRHLRRAIARLNPKVPEAVRQQAVETLTRIDHSRSLLQHNREFYGYVRDGVPVEWRDESGETRHARVKIIDFRDAGTNDFLAVRELKIQGVRVPHYNRRADLVCFVNGLSPRPCGPPSGAQLNRRRRRWRGRGRPRASWRDRPSPRTDAGRTAPP